MSTFVPESMLAPFSLVSAPALRTTDARFWDKPSIRDFDLGATDKSVALQAAIDAGAANRKSVYIPAGDYSFNAGVTMTSQFGIEGDGDGQSTLTTVDFNGSLFTIRTAGAAIQSSFIKDLNARAFFTSNAVAGANAAFVEYSSGTADYIQHCKFQNLGVEGFPTGFRNSATTRTTAFGQESYVNWIRYEDIRLTTFSRSVKVGWDFITGSGTGNTFTGIDSNIGGMDPDGVNRPGTLIRARGAGCVVGDILINNSHLAGYPGSVLLEGAVGTLYRQRISINNIQADAGLDNILSLDTTGNEWSNIVINGNNVGGNAKIADGIPAIRSSIVDDQNVGCWRTAHYVTGLPTGSQSIALFDVYLDNNDATYLTMTASGLVQGVTSGICLYRGLMYRVTGNGILVAQDNNIQNPVSASSYLFSLTPTAYGVRVGVSIVPTGAGSTMDVQIEAKGGKVRIVRI